MSDIPATRPSQPVALPWRGYVVLMFADLCDYTQLGELYDPEDVDDLRRQFEQLAHDVVQRHGGSVTQMYGDGMLAVFGFPMPREDDPRRAVGAALELRDAVHGLRLRLSEPSAVFECRLHSGVHAGLVFAREGDTINGRYTLTGDAVSTASRLCSAAQRDEIVISDAVKHGIEGFFAISTADDVTLKGKKLPLATYRVLGGLGERSSFQARCRRGLTGFVGREAELDQLIALLHDALRGRTRQITLQAAAGVGKSRLLEEFRQRLAIPGLCTLQGYCEPYGDVVPLQPFVQMLRQLCGLTPTGNDEESVATATRRIKALVGAEGDTHSVLLQLLEVRTEQAVARVLTERVAVRVFTELYGALLREGPLLLLLDDWQWADDTSRKVLASLQASAGEAALCIVSAERSTQLNRPLVTGERLELRPFLQSESDRVVRALRGQGLSESVARALHERSGGNPLFLEELCRALPTGGFGGDAGLQSGGMPITLHGVIQARLASLPEHAARVLQTASIIGTEFTDELLLELCPDQPVLLALEGLVHEDLVYALERPGTYRFKHGITREVVYESVRMSERRGLHAAIAAQLARDLALDALAGRAEALAYHYRGCGDYARAAEFGERAGDKALAALALDRARLQFSLALSSLGMLEPTVDNKRKFVAIGARWAGPCIYSPSREQLELLTRAARYAQDLGDLAAHGEVLNMIGWILYVLGDYDSAQKHFELALAQTTEQTRLYVQLQVNLGQCYAAAGEYTQAFVHLSEGIERKDERGGGRESLAIGTAYALGSRAASYGDRGELELAERDLGRALGLIGESRHPIAASIWALAAMIALQRGDLERCEEAAETSRKLAERVNSHYVFVTSSAYGAYARYLLQREPEALTQLRTCVDWLESRGTRLFLSFAQGCLAHALAVAGDWAAAEAYAQRALVRAEQRDPLGEAAAYRALARAQHATGRTAEVAQSLHLALAAAQRRESPRERALTLQLAAALLPGELEGAVHAQRELDAMGVRWQVFTLGSA